MIFQRLGDAVLVMGITGMEKSEYQSARRSGHRVIGSSGHLSSNAFEFRWPDRPMFLHCEVPFRRLRKTATSALIPAWSAGSRSGAKNGEWLEGSVTPLFLLSAYFCGSAPPRLM